MQTLPPAGLVLRSPFTSLTDVAAAHYPGALVRAVLRDRFESARHLARSDVPVVVLSGDADQIVPPASSAALAAADEALPDLADIKGQEGAKRALDQALAYADALSAYPLRWYEEAGDPLDHEELRLLAERYEGPLATGENLLSFQEARNLIRYGGLRPDRDILQMDPALSYGLTEFRRTVAMLAAALFYLRQSRRLFRQRATRLRPWAAT